ncbi:hypothetical protein ACS0TY_030718 [Phlomoides rotata]
MVVVNGFWKEDGTNISIVNVYAPSLASKRWTLWDTIQSLTEQYKDSCLCGTGDFNSIRNQEERRGRGSSWDIRDIDKFNDFILQSDLIDIQLTGRFFTWYRSNDSCKSKLDRVLVNAEWINKWPHFAIKEGKRTVSDQYESARRLTLMKELLANLKWKDASLFQKSQAKWIAEGDCNSKLFHSFINKWNKSNEITDFWSEGRYIESVKGVKEEVFDYFKSHYSSSATSRPKFLPTLFYQ